jgi:hypothetical protein
MPGLPKAENLPCAGCRALTAELRRDRRDNERVQIELEAKLVLLSGAARQVVKARARVQSATGTPDYPQAKRALDAFISELERLIPPNEKVIP